MGQRVSLALFAALMLVGPAFGHAKLLSAVPAADSQLAEPPRSLTLTFNENVRLAALKLTAAGHDVPVPIDRAAVASSVVKIVLPPLSAGTYAVSWSALTVDDGHVVKGTYSFTVR